MSQAPEEIALTENGGIENGTDTSAEVSWDTLKFSVRHLTIALALAAATIADGFNDNFVVFTHDDRVFQCEGGIERSKCPSNSSIACSPEFYDRPDMTPNQTTYASEYGLVCEKSYLKTWLVSGMFFGVLCTSPLNFMADLYGRKRIMMISCFIQGIVILVASQSDNYWIYGCALFISGLCGGLKFKAGSVLTAESVPIDKRDTFCTIFGMGWTVGYAMLPLLAYIVPDWRMMVLYIAVLNFASTLIIQFMSLESTPWLFQNGKDDQVRSNLKSLLPNDEVLRDKVYTQLQAGKANTDDETNVLENLKILLSHRLLVPKILVCSYSWFTVSLLWRSFALGTSELEGSPYWNCFYSSAFDTVAMLSGLALIKLVGRRGSSTATLGVCSVFTVACAIFSTDKFYSGQVIRWCSMISKVGFVGTHNILYIYTAEMFPTMQRSTALGVVSLFDGLAGVVAPYFLQYRSTNQVNQYIMQSGLTFVAAILIMCILPETTGISLPTTENDVQQLEETRLFYGKSRSKK